MSPRLSSGRPLRRLLLSPGLRVPLAIVVASLILWWLCQYHGGAMPVWAPWDFAFSWFYAAAFPLWWYGRGLALASPGERPPAWRTALFLLGIGLIYAVLQTRYEYLAEHMFFLHRFQHVVMHHLGPFLIALAWPWRTLLRGMPPAVRRIAEGPFASGVLRVMRRPLLAATLFVGLVAFWLIPPVHFRAMIDPRLYLLMNWSMVADGVFFWALVLDPRPAGEAHISFGMRAAIGVGVMFPQIMIGAIIALSRHDLYSFYAWCGRIYPSIGPLEDQSYGGLIIWIPPAMMSAVSLLLVLNALRLAEERRERQPGESDIVTAAPWTGRG